MEDIIQLCDQESVRNLRLTCKPLHKLCNRFFVVRLNSRGAYCFACNRQGLSKLIRLTEHPEAWKRIRDIKLGAYRLPEDLIETWLDSNELTLGYDDQIDRIHQPERIGRARLRMERIYHEDVTLYWEGPTAIRLSDPQYAFCLAKDDQLELEYSGEAQNMLFTALGNLRAQGASSIRFHIWADGLSKGRGSKQYDELRALGCELPRPRSRNSFWHARYRWSDRTEEQIRWACFYAGIDLSWCHCMNSVGLCESDA